MAIKYTNTMHSKALQNAYTQIGIMSMKMYHLATLHSKTQRPLTRGRKSSLKVVARLWVPRRPINEEDSLLAQFTSTIYKRDLKYDFKNNLQVRF
jgi:hypothetical protein